MPDHHRAPRIPRDLQMEWVAEVRAGNVSAFSEIVHAYFAPLVAFACARSKSREDAEDAVQDVLLALWAQRDHWILEQSLPSYLYRAVLNRVNRQGRTTKLDQTLDSGDTSEIADTAAPTSADDTISET